MKKIIILFVIIASFYPAYVRADGGTSVNGYGWTLLGADVVFTGSTIWAVMDEINAANNYASLKSSIDNTTMENYYQLLYQKSQVDMKSNLATYLGITAGVALAYTFVDFFWLHNAFSQAKVGVEVNYNPLQKEYMMMVKKEF